MHRLPLFAFCLWAKGRLWITGTLASNNQVEIKGN